MKRLLVIFLLGLAVCAGALFALRDRMAQSAVWSVLNSVEALAAGQGLRVEQLRLEKTTMIGLTTIVCTGISGTVRFENGSEPPVGRDGIMFEVGQVEAVLESFLGSRARVMLDNGTVVTIDRAGTPTGQRVNGIRAAVDIDFEWRQPSEAARNLIAELAALVRQGSCRLNGVFEGKARFQVDGKWHEAGLRSETRGTRFGIVIDPEDVRQISKDYVHPLTETEMELVSRFPFRAPTLLRLSEQATSAAERLRALDRSFPYDAYRHVYWSWLLTREYGPEFSERVTDAHEVGATYETAEAARRMDLRNNSVGRAYALAGVPEIELAERVLRDPNVQRTLR